MLSMSTVTNKQTTAAKVSQLLRIVCLFGFCTAASAYAEPKDVSSFEDILDKHRQVRYINTFLGALNTGRYEAMRREQAVTACPSLNGKSCSPHAEWNQGWIMFVDKNNDAYRGNQDTLLWSHGEMSEGFTLKGSAAVARSISYNAKGETTHTGALIFCDNRGATSARSIVISESSPSAPEASLNTSFSCPPSSLPANSALAQN